MSAQVRSTTVVSPASLLAELADENTTVVVLDVRQAGDRPDADAYRAGHIPGATFVDLDADLAGISDGSNGGRPLPAPEVFEKTVRRWGIGHDTPVVVYGATRTPAPGRAWWLLRWAGVNSVRLLDGGLDGWVAHGGSLQSGDAGIDSTESDFVIGPGELPVIEAADVQAYAHRNALLDARAAAKFSNPSDSSAGHIPGARSVPAVELYDENGYLLPDDELRGLLTDKGVDLSGEPAAYCGTGVAAALEVLVLSLLGIRTHLFVGSMSEWSADPSRPLQR